MKTARMLCTAAIATLLAQGSFEAAAGNLIRVPVDDAYIATYGSTPPGNVTLSAPAFGDIGLGESAQIDAVLSNTRHSTINLDPIGAGSVTGTGFSFVSTTCGGTLASNQSCSVRVQMDNVLGVYSGTLNVTDSAGTQTASLSGSRSSAAHGLAWTIAPSSAGVISLGSTFDYGVTFRNSGNVTITNVTFTSAYAPGYAVTSTACTNVTLAPGQTCAASIRLTTWRYGGYGAWLYPTYKYGGVTQNPTDTSFILEAFVQDGAPAGLTLSTYDLDFGTFAVGATVGKTVTLTNNRGTSFVTSAGAVSANNNFATATWASHGCGWTTLAPATSCSEIVTLKATKPGLVTGTLLIADSANNEKVFVRIHGTAQ